MKIFLSILFLILSFSYARSNNLFLEEIQSKREDYINKNVLSFSYANNSSVSAGLYSMQVSPFYKWNFLLNNFAIRLNYIDYNIDEFYSNKNYEVVLVYNIIKHEFLTLYLNYAIYSMYNLRFYDFDTDKDVNLIKYGKSFSLGFDTNIYNNLYLTFEKRWVNVEENYIKDLDSFYIGLKYKVSLKILKEG
ncbi:MAG: hypothetical protein LBH40_06485 [Alphaproteobacteria bacterium]|jgi:hypothetical protein|nr:hypothetical protein [Alphaproteobacteria bacterium]